MEHEQRWSAQELRVELNKYESELRASGKTRNTVNTYVQHPERFVNWLEGRYRPQQTLPISPLAGASESVVVRHAPGRSRYEPLMSYLSQQPDQVVRLSFEQIEQIIRGSLPASARKHRPWWANERSGSHVHAAAWMKAGRRTTNVQLDDGTVDFELEPRPQALAKA